MKAMRTINQGVEENGIFCILDEVILMFRPHCNNAVKYVAVIIYSWLLFSLYGHERRQKTNKTAS